MVQIVKWKSVGTGADLPQCQRMGGTGAYYPDYVRGQGYIYTCYVSPVAAPAPSVTITSEVSPQISPVMQQQFQPQDSPMTAGTSQTGVTGRSEVAAPPPPSAPMPTPAPYIEPAPGPSYPIERREPESIAIPVQPVAAAFDWKTAAITAAIVGAGIFGVVALSKR